VEGSLASASDFLRNSNSLQFRSYSPERRARAIAARLRRSDSSVAPAEAPARAKAALDNYQANIRVLRSLAQAYNFKVLVFWQPPLASGNKPLTPFEQQFQSDSAGSSQPNSFAILKAVNDEAARRSLQGGDFILLGHVFESVQCKNLFTSTISCTSARAENKSSRVRSLSRSKTIRRNRHQTKRTVWAAQ
jgi:hypothetical protein